MPYYRNLAPTGPLPAIRRAIIVIHGKSRHADGAMQAVVDAGTPAERAETIVLAPFFQPRKPNRPFQLYWDDGWEEGALSETEAPQIPRRGSFVIVDTFVQLLANRAAFPNLREIVVAGHSAGGQLSQRYAALSRFDAPAPLRVRYVVSNPGTYMYLSAHRYLSGTFVVPPQPIRMICSTWNHYRYGLQARPSYAAAASDEQVRTQFPRRVVTYLLGGDDTGKEDLDQSCAASLEGKHRLARGKTFFAFMNAFFPGHKHDLVIAPGQPHSAGMMYRSPEGRAALYRVLP